MNGIVIFIFFLIYSIIFILGVVGNAFVIFLTLKHRKLQTVQVILFVSSNDIVEFIFTERDWIHRAMKKKFAKFHGYKD